MSSNQEIDIAIIGGGILGLACAERLSRENPKRSIVLLEKAERTGTGNSSRNSEVIHSGIYYPQHSLKAIHCSKGNRLLYEWCQKYQVAHENLGKLVIASQREEEEQIEALYQNGRENGVEGLEILTGQKVKSMETEIKGIAALWVPSSGIVSVHEFMDSLEGRFQNQKGLTVLHSEVIGVEQKQDQYELTLRYANDSKGKQTETFQSQFVINATGMHADLLAEKLGINIDQENYRQYFCKGNYFKVNRARGKFSHLIYPVPNPDQESLGIHITLDLAGEVRLGPDKEWLNDRTLNFQVDAQRSELFYENVSRYWPKVRDYAIEADYAGIRNKRTRQGFSDFAISEESRLGFPGWVNLIGIESPGLTAALSIAETVAKFECFQ